MNSHDRAALEVPRLRRGAHRFLRRLAAHAWEHENESGRWEITLPPDVAALPEHQRFRVHARQEARRLARAQLYDLDGEISRQAVCLGAAIREGQHDEAAAPAGHPLVAVTLGIEPPAPAGFVRWRDAIGCNGLGAPVVACHWGPAPGGGRWLAWWADSRAMAAAWAAEAEAEGQHLDTSFVPLIFGPIMSWAVAMMASTRPSRLGACAAGAAPSSTAAASVCGVSVGTMISSLALMCRFGTRLPSGRVTGHHPVDGIGRPTRCPAHH
jgi:hypothetical protein